MSNDYVFYIRGISCASCTSSIQSILTREGFELTSFSVIDMESPATFAKETRINLKNHRECNIETWIKIKQAMDEGGFTCEERDYKPANEQTVAEQLNEESSSFTLKAKKILTSHWFLGVVGCGLGILFLILSLALGGLPLAALIPFGILSTILTLILGAQSFHEAWKKLTLSHSLTMDTLFAFSTLAVLAVSIAAFFLPWLPMMFEAGLLIYGFRHIGIAIEDTIKEKIKSVKFQDRAPKQVTLYTLSEQAKTNLEFIQPDDVLIINPGELIPADGLCLQESMLYTTIISGATLPQAFQSGQKVLAGMRLAENTTPLKIKVTKTMEDSYLARLDKGIASSMQEKAPLEIKTTQILGYFIPGVIGLALSAGIIISLFFPPALAIQCAIAVLVSACPCTLGLIIPLAVKTGIYKAANHGVRFKSSRELQQAEQIDTVLFDLNGTLTTGVPVVKQAVLKNNTISHNKFLALCAELEKQSSHPIGKAIKLFAKKNSTNGLIASEINARHHSGIVGQIDNKTYTLGNMNLMQQQGIATGDLEGELQLEAGDSLIFLAEEQNIIGYFIMTDPLRVDACKTVQHLINMGKDVQLCTGADENTANRYAKALGIKTVYAHCVATTIEVTDRSKPAYITWLRKQGRKISMVGDAANDAQALAASDFGIAIRSHDGDELTQHNAGAIIQNGSLLPIAHAFTVSMQTVSNIKQNLIMSLSYNTAILLVTGGLLIGLGFVLNPGVGVALMVIQACIILLNVYRFKQQAVSSNTDNVNSSSPEEDMITSHQTMQQHFPGMTSLLKSENNPPLLVEGSTKRPAPTFLAQPEPTLVYNP